MSRLIFHAVIIACFILLMQSVGYAVSIPEEARRNMARGHAAVEMAKTPADLEDAAKEFHKALDLAPKWPAPYYNLGLVQEKAGKLKEAVVSFKQYLHLAPNAPNAEKIQEQIYKLEYKAEQVLTVPEIIDVLVSFSHGNLGWRLTEGGCQTENMAIKHVDDNSVSVPLLLDVQISPRFPDGVGWGTRKVEGTIFKYTSNHKRTNKICGSDRPWEGHCPYMEIEIEVVSKRHVKIRQKIVELYGIDTPFAGKIYSCEYRRK